MSKLEESVICGLGNKGISIKREVKYYINVPWSNRRYQTVDLYLPQIDLFIEVKGFMTMEVMMKKIWLAQHMTNPYYLFQGTEKDWNVPLGLDKKSIRDNIDFQIQEISTLVQEQQTWDNIETTRRIHMFFLTKLRQYEQLTGISQYNII